MFRSARSQRALTPQTELQITPLIDMVFILLIFFMVTTHFVSEVGLQIERPEATTARMLPQENISVAVSRTGDISLDGQRVGLFAVRPWIERKLRVHPRLTVVVVADKTLPMERVVHVMDEIRAGGIDQIALATAEPE